MEQVRAEDDGGARLGAPDDRGLHAPDADRVEPGERLVEQQRPGLVQQPAGDGELLLHSARELARQRRRACSPAPAPRAAPGIRASDVGHLIEPADEAQVLLDGEVLEQVRLVRDEREQRLGGHRRRAPGRGPPIRIRPRLGMMMPGDAPDGRGLARRRSGPTSPSTSPGPHLEGETPDRREVAVELLAAPRPRSRASVAAGPAAGAPAGETFDGARNVSGCNIFPTRVRYPASGPGGRTYANLLVANPARGPGHLRRRHGRAHAVARRTRDKVTAW